jgi:predicted DNA-binding transcriptional regulator AlpA
MTNLAHENDTEASFLDIPGAATLLCFKPSTLYAWKHQQRLPFPYRMHGKKIVFLKSDLLAWSERQTVFPMPGLTVSMPALQQEPRKQTSSLTTRRTKNVPTLPEQGGKA